MKRGWTLSMCALALIAGAAANAQAQAPNVQLSLNLRYTNPAAPAQGGSWYLVGKTNSANGIAGVSAYVSNVNAAGAIMGTTASNGYTAVAPAQINALTGGNFISAGPPVNIVYGQDTSAAGVVTGVGTATFAQRQVADPLKNTAWDNSTVLASGTFGGSRPDFVAAGGNTTDANTLPGLVAPFNNAVDANTTVTVRGDSVNTLNLESANGTEGLRRGDRNRDFSVNLTLDIFPSLAAINQGAGKTWEQGDFNGDGSVNLTTDIFPALASINQPGLPPSAGAVPEPATATLLLAGMFAFAARQRRRS